jgi:1,4-beta-N-acetylmuramidase
VRVFFAVLTSLATIFSPQLSSQVQTYVSNTSTIHTVAEQADATREHDIVEARAQEQKLPEDIADSISNADTVVSSEYVAKDDGTLVYAQTGEKVTDPKIVGTQEEVPDPLARTNGESFIPVSVEAAREIIDDADTSEEEIPQQEDTPQNPDRENSAQQDDPTQLQASSAAYIASAPSVRSVGNWSSNYGAKWGSYNGQQAFFEGDGSLFVVPASKVIDVSEWQGDINWDAVKADGVQGAIIRIGYGTDATDKKALRNLREVQRVGLPFGVYLYSYASNWSEAWAEGSNVVSILKKAGITSSKQMSMPIFYDLENWTYAGHKHPTSPAVYDTIVNNFFMSVQLSGYGKVSVYSYTSFLKSVLNTSNIHSRTSWVASYGSSPRFAINSYEKGWQYTSTGSVNGISGNVDLNAYRLNTAVASVPVHAPQIQMNSYPVVTIPNGEYYINSRVKDSSSVDIVNGSTTSGVAINLYQYNQSAAQKFRFIRNSNGTYTITNSASGKVLDVYGGSAKNKQTVWQYDRNGSVAQQWYIRDMGDGYALQTALGNFVLDVDNASSVNGTRISLYEPAATVAQRFVMASTTPLKNTNKVNILSAANGDKALDILSGSTSNSAPIQIYTYNKSTAQTFTFKQVGNGLYEIVNMKSGRVIDVANGSATNGSRVWQYNNNHTQAQHWAVHWNNNNQIVLASMASGKVLDVPNGAVVDKNQLQIYTANYSVAQKWYLQDTNSNTSTDIADGDYYIAPAAAPKLALDVYGGGTTNLTNVWLYTFNGSIAQQWVVKHDSQGNISITNRGSKKALDIRNGSTQSGTNVDIYTNNNTAAQKWKLKKAGNNRFVITSVANSHNVLDVQNGAFRAGSNVWVYTANNSSAQTWQFTKVG